MKIFRSDQIREIDKYTIEHEPVSSVDLMERAAVQLFNWISQRFRRSDHFVVFVGPGNNGGDGLVLSRMLSLNGYNSEVYFVKVSEKTSPDWKLNHKRLAEESDIELKNISDVDHFPVITSDDIIIDALFGSGLTRPVDGLVFNVIKHINNSGATVVSVDMPSGLFGEDNTRNNYEAIIRADVTLSFQFPKLSFMFAETASLAGEWVVLPIGLDASAIRNTPSPYTIIYNSDIAPLLKKRKKFDHKGTFGHGLLIAGSTGKMGAAVLGASAALRAGIGLITCHIPSGGNIIVQSAIPEAMVIPDKSENNIMDVGSTDRFDSIGIGPGLGTTAESQKMLQRLLSECKKPIVIDADALNILSMNKSWLSLLPAEAILTPHPKEFERLAGSSGNSFERLQKQIRFSKEFKCIVVLKGAQTSISVPGGKVMFNSTGNPGMATAGSGDVLTGIILSLLAQGYSPENAAVTGVYLHGTAGDIAAEKSGLESIIASDIIKCIGKAFNKIREL